MINSRNFVSQLKLRNINFITGVPDSLLKNFISSINSSFTESQHLIAANEGNAIALACGHFISTNTPALVYMQNSGLGNAVNPLTSLSHENIYSIPMLLMIGWRGEPGIEDEPQHSKQGQITEQLLENLDIPVFKINSSTNYELILEDAFKKMREKNSPVALLISKDTFNSDDSSKEIYEGYDLDLPTREQAIESILKVVASDTLIISTTGMASRELFEIRKKNNQGHAHDFLTVGSMGHASSIALSVALNLPSRKVVCIDGDGSVLMHMGSLGIIGQSKATNLLHILLNNGAHDSVGGQPTVGLKIKLKEIAHSSGYKNSSSTQEIESLETNILKLQKIDGPNFLEMFVGKGSRSNLGRPNLNPQENMQNFMRNINNA